MSHVIRTFLLILAACTLHAASAQAEEMQLTRFQKSSGQYLAGKLVTEIYRRSGLEAHISPMPPARARLMALSGESDGEVARIEAYGIANPELTLVRPAYDETIIAAFSKKPLVIKSRDDLKKYSVGILLGAQASKDLTEGHPNVQVANSSTQLFLMLDAGRFEIVLDADINGYHEIKMARFESIKMVGTMQKSEVFTVLSPKKKQWAEKISITIKSMKKSGELEQLRKHYLDEFLQSGLTPD